MIFEYYDTMSTLISGSVLIFVLSSVLGWDIDDIISSCLWCWIYAQRNKCSVGTSVLLVHGWNAIK